MSIVLPALLVALTWIIISGSDALAALAVQFCPLMRPVHSVHRVVSETGANANSENNK
jgi:hypothetical protein